MKVCFTIGRFNPPTIGHERLIETLLEVSSSVKIVFIVDGEKSRFDLNRNPLSADFRKKIIEDAYGIRCEIVSTAYEAFEVLDVMGLDTGVLICGNDRVKSYQSIMKSYGIKFDIRSIDRGNRVSGTEARNCSWNKEKFLEFMSIKIDSKTIEDIRQVIMKSKKVHNE